MVPIEPVWSSFRLATLSTPAQPAAAFLSLNGRRRFGPDRSRRRSADRRAPDEYGPRSGQAGHCNQRVPTFIDAAVRRAGSAAANRRRGVTIAAFNRAKYIFRKNCQKIL